MVDDIRKKKYFLVEVEYDDTVYPPPEYQEEKVDITKKQIELMLDSMWEKTMGRCNVIACDFNVDWDFLFGQLETFSDWSSCWDYERSKETVDYLRQQMIFMNYRKERF